MGPAHGFVDPTLADWGSGGLVEGDPVRHPVRSPRCSFTRSPTFRRCSTWNRFGTRPGRCGERGPSRSGRPAGGLSGSRDGLRSNSERGPPARSGLRSRSSTSALSRDFPGRNSLSAVHEGDDAMGFLEHPRLREEDTEKPDPIWQEDLECPVSPDASAWPERAGHQPTH